MEKRGHPGEVAPADEVESAERQAQGPDRRLASHRRHHLAEGQTLVPGRRVVRARKGLVFDPQQNDRRQHDARRPKGVERGAPAVFLGNPAGHQPADNHARIGRRLVDRHGQRAGLLVILPDERVGRRVVEGFAAARRQSAEDDQRQQPAACAGKQRGRAPHQQAPEHDPLATQHVACVAGHGHERGVGQHEDRRDQAALPVAEPQVLRQRREHHAVDHPVGLVEEIGPPEQEDQFPLVGQPATVIGHPESLLEPAEGSRCGRSGQGPPAACPPGSTFATPLTPSPAARAPRSRNRRSSLRSCAGASAG